MIYARIITLLNYKNKVINIYHFLKLKMFYNTAKKFILSLCLIYRKPIKYIFKVICDKNRKDKQLLNAKCFKFSSFSS